MLQKCALLTRNKYSIYSLIHPLPSVHRRVTEVQGVFSFEEGADHHFFDPGYSG